MPNRSFADEIERAEVTLSGLRLYQDVLNTRGLDEAFALRLEGEIRRSLSINNEQEDLKGQLKSKTAELDSSVENLHKLCSEVRTVAKLYVPKENWKSFGMK